MEYLIKSTAILTIFYIFYKIFLQGETFFQSIRSFFLAGIISALVLPLVFIPKYIEVEPLNLSNVNFVNSASIGQNPTFNWIQFSLIIYLMGVGFFAIRFLAQVSSLLWFLYTHPKSKSGKYNLVNTQKNLAPFSFFNYIVFNTNKFKPGELEQIMRHEQVHVNQLHSLDMILTHLIVVLNWFNPFVWGYKNETQKNLEFIADEFAQNFTPEKKTYQYLLLKSIAPNYQMPLTSNFYNSIIKKRISMLQKNRSHRIMQIKFALIIPILTAFIFTFNTKVIAQHKNIKTIELNENFEVEIISKDFQKSDLESLKNRLASKGLTFKYKKLKFNENGEIISLNISVKSNTGNQANLSQSSSVPIKPIQIKFDTQNGSLSLSNISGMPHEHENVFISSGASGMHKKVIVKKMGDGDEDLIWISEGDSKTMHSKDGNSFIFLSDDDKGHKEKYVIKVDKDSDIHFGDDHGNLTKVWVSEDGDSTKMKKIEIIEIDKGNDGSHKVIIKRSGNSTDDEDIIIKSSTKIHKGGEHAMFISSDGEKPLIFVDGKELKDGKLEDIDPDNIEKIEVFKGDKAVEKYGKKAKDGVIKITTKK